MKPTRKGPWWALALSLYVTVAWLINAFTGNDGMATSLAVFGCGVGALSLAWWWMERRLQALDAWKQRRELEWLLDRKLPED